MPLLTIIIPFGLSKERAYIKDRVILKAKEFKSDEKVCYIFVEGYSSTPLEASLECARIIKENGHLYLKDESQKEYFSQGQCRNFAARHTKTPCMMVLDVDYILTIQNLEKILKIIEIKQIHQNPAAFFVLPCIFLNEIGTLKFANKELVESEILQDLIYGKKEFIEFIMEASSSIVLNTYTFLELGGYDDSYVGFGSEEFDFLWRFLRRCANFELLPKELHFDARKSNLKSFKGFRSLFSMLGLEASLSGIYLYHLYHERPNQNNYMNNFTKNRKLLLKRFLKPVELDSLTFANTKEKICILHDEGSILSKTIQKPCVFLGKYVSVSETIFFDDEEFNEQRFLSFIEENQITRFMFFNYYKDQKKTIYFFLKQKQIPFFIFERGAFPDSWFFDDSGFLADSKNYDELLWNKAINEEELSRTKAYISELLRGDSFLEDKNQFFSENELKASLGLRHKRVIFVPLQVESDTAIRFFTKEPFTYEGFLQILNELAPLYAKEQVVFVCKKHPLAIELNKKAYENLIFADDECSILSLLNISCACVCLNSGVGLYAMISKIPAVLCARAFYRFEGLNLEAHTKEELKAKIDEILEGKFHFDEQKMLRFIKYLKEDFYSFANTESVVLKNYRGHSNFRRTIKWNFYQITLGKSKVLDAKCFKKQEYKLDSLHYLPFAYELKKDYKSFLRANKIDEKLRIGITMPHFLERFKAYRLLRKLLKNPKAFFADSKNPLFYPIKKVCLRKTMEI